MVNSVLHSGSFSRLRTAALAATTGILTLVSPVGLFGCDAPPLEYQSCYPKGERPPAVSPLYDCFIEWCASACDDPDKAHRERREEQLLAPDGDTAEQCWEEKTGTSDQYVDLQRGCTYAETYSADEQR